MNFQLVGHNPLFGRGMNAAATIYGHYIYIGNRTDGSSACRGGGPARAWQQLPAPAPGRADR